MTVNTELAMSSALFRQLLRCFALHWAVNVAISRYGVVFSGLIF